MRPARAPGRAGGRPAQQRGRACVLIVAAARRPARGSWGYAPRGAAGQCGLWRPPRTHPP
eukprot:2167768-Prymnesium_polylepis.1